MARRGYIFTDKKESKQGILSSVLGALSLASLIAAVYLTFQNQGVAPVKYGVVGLLCLIFSGTGLTLPGGRADGADPVRGRAGECF